MGGAFNAGLLFEVCEERVNEAAHHRLEAGSAVTACLLLGGENHMVAILGTFKGELKIFNCLTGTGRLKRYM